MADEPRDLAHQATIDAPERRREATTPANLPRSDRYQLGERLGRGAGGFVSAARDDVLDREVAVKTLHRARQEDEQGLERFLYEARTAGRLGHPGVIPVYDLGVGTDGSVFYVMPNVSGRDLGLVLTGLRDGDPASVEAFPLPRLLHVFARICNTVAYAHDHGYLHRDLKPANVMLGSYGEVFVGDWGLAKHQGTITEESRPRPGAATEHGQMLGTIHYMSPEQVHGDLDEVTAASDAWSLGVILYELLTLRRPFSGDVPFRLMLSISKGAVPDPRKQADGVPDAMAELCLAALSRDPAGRPDVLTLAKRTEAFLDGVEARAHRAEWARRELTTAQALRDEYQDARAQLAEARRTVTAAARALPLDAPLRQRMRLWEQQEALREQSQAAEHLFSRTTSAANRALHADPGEAAREELADLYWLKVCDAEQSHDEGARLYFRALVEAHDTGRYAERLAGSAWLRVTVDAVDATVEVLRQVSFGPLLVDRAVELPTEGGEVPAGSYVVATEAPGRVATRTPVMVRGRVELALCPPAAADWDEAFVPVAGGRYEIGGDDGAPHSLSARVVEVAPFALARRPVTVGAYCAFLDDVAARDEAAAMAHAPRAPGGVGLRRLRPGGAALLRARPRPGWRRVARELASVPAELDRRAGVLRVALGARRGHVSAADGDRVGGGRARRRPAAVPVGQRVRSVAVSHGQPPRRGARAGRGGQPRAGRVALRGARHGRPGQRVDLHAGRG